MAHKTLVNGTSYEVKGGRTLVGGTGYDIKSGRTLVDGVGYDVNFGDGMAHCTITYNGGEAYDLAFVPGMAWSDVIRDKIHAVGTITTHSYMEFLGSGGLVALATWYPSGSIRADGDLWNESNMVQIKTSDSIIDGEIYNAYIHTYVG